MHNYMRDYMRECGPAMLVHLAQSDIMEVSQAALDEIKRRGFEYEDLHEEFNS